MSSAAPVLAPQIQQVYLPLTNEVSKDFIYTPYIIGAADVLYNSTKHGVTVSKSYTMLTPLNQGPVPIDWSEAKFIELNLRNLDVKPIEGATYANYPDAAANVKNYENWKKLLTQYIRTDLSLKLLFSPTLKVISEAGENERDFRIRIQQLARESRDEAVETLKKKYTSKINVLEDREMRAKQTLEKQSTRANQKKMEAAVSAGTAILGAIFGRRSINATSISRVGTAFKSTTRAFQSGEGIDQAQETLQSVETQLQELEMELNQEVEQLSEGYDLTTEKLEEVEIRVTSENITVQFVGLAWVPQD